MSYCRAWYLMRRFRRKRDNTVVYRHWADPNDRWWSSTSSCTNITDGMSYDADNAPVVPTGAKNGMPEEDMLGHPLAKSPADYWSAELHDCSARSNYDPFLDSPERDIAAALAAVDWHGSRVVTAGGDVLVGCGDVDAALTATAEECVVGRWPTAAALSAVHCGAHVDDRISDRRVYPARSGARAIICESSQ